jgi:hypothetical protein
MEADGHVTLAQTKSPSETVQRVPGWLVYRIFYRFRSTFSALISRARSTKAVARCRAPLAFLSGAVPIQIWLRQPAHHCLGPLYSSDKRWQPISSLARSARERAASSWAASTVGVFLADFAEHPDRSGTRRRSPMASRGMKAVRAAISASWSNGRTKGQIMRLKLVRRQMYGRGNIDLLKSG